MLTHKVRYYAFLQDQVNSKICHKKKTYKIKVRLVKRGQSNDEAIITERKVN